MYRVAVLATVFYFTTVGSTSAFDDRTALVALAESMEQAAHGFASTPECVAAAEETSINALIGIMSSTNTSKLSELRRNSIRVVIRCMVSQGNSDADAI